MFTHLYGVWNTDDTDGIDKHGLFLEEWDNRNDFPAVQKIDAYILSVLSVFDCICAHAVALV